MLTSCGLSAGPPPRSTGLTEAAIWLLPPDSAITLRLSQLKCDASLMIACLIVPLPLVTTRLSYWAR